LPCLFFSFVVGRRVYGTIPIDEKYTFAEFQACLTDAVKHKDIKAAVAQREQPPGGVEQIIFFIIMGKITRAPRVLTLLGEPIYSALWKPPHRSVQQMVDLCTKKAKRQTTHTQSNIQLSLPGAIPPRVWLR